MTDTNKLPVATAPPTGSPSVDAEHGVQLGLLEATLSALEPDGSGDAGELMEQLHGYTQVHFMSEQLLMRRAARANYDSHIEDHELLMKELDEARDLLVGGDHAGACERLQSHQAHLLGHIRSWDRSVEE